MKLNFILFFIIFFCSFTAYAIRWPKAKIELTHPNNNTQVYITSYQGERKLILELPLYVKDYYGTQLGIDQNRNIVGISFTDKKENFWVLFFDLSSGKISPYFLNYFQEYDVKKVVALYDKEKNAYSVVPMFEPCKNPFVYHDNIKTSGPELYSTFLPNGNLYIKSYTLKNGADHYFTIPINYQKLYADCRGQ